MSIVVSHIGLPDREVKLLTSIFNVLALSAAPGFDDEFDFVPDQQNKLTSNSQKNADQDLKFIGKEQRSAPGRLADIIFVDGDNKFAFNTWKTLQQTNPLTVPVIVTNTNDSPNCHTIKRPLMLKRIISALTAIITTDRKKTLSQLFRLNILVVDDSFAVRKYMEHTLPKLVDCELTIEFAGSGEEAIERMSRHGYGLVFLDVVMPGIDGYKTCKSIKAKHDSYVVMLTSKKSPFDKVRGTMSGCDAYITKPPKDIRLKKALDKCIGDTNNLPQIVNS